MARSPPRVGGASATRVADGGVEQQVGEVAQPKVGVVANEHAGRRRTLVIGLLGSVVDITLSGLRTYVRFQSTATVSPQCTTSSAMRRRAPPEPAGVAGGLIAMRYLVTLVAAFGLLAAGTALVRSDEPLVWKTPGSPNCC